MTALLLAACIGMIAGCFFLLKLNPLEFTNGVFRSLLNRPESIREKISKETQRKKASFLRREIEETQAILALTGRSKRFPAICATSLLLLAIGAGAAILMQNMFLVPVIAVGMMFLPFWYVKLTAVHYKKDVSAELETALSIITTAYLRTEDILTAVEENLGYLNPPVQSVFSAFAMRLKSLDPDITAAIRSIKGQIDNDVFREWCDAIADCQYDRSLKSTLTPTVNKLSDMRIVNGELENLVFEPRKEFICMSMLVVGNMPFLFFLNRSWFLTLTQNPAGQVMLALSATAIFICTAFMIKFTKPIEYRR